MLSEVANVEVIGTTGDAVEGLTLARDLKPDVVVLDLLLPPHSGIEVLSHLRHHVPPSRIIIFTNYPYRQARQRCVDLGVRHVLDKSRDVLTLLNLVRSMSEEAR